MFRIPWGLFVEFEVVLLVRLEERAFVVLERLLVLDVDDMLFIVDVALPPAAAELALREDSNC